MVDVELPSGGVGGRWSLEQFLFGGLTLPGISRFLVKEGLVGGVPRGQPSLGVQPNDPTDISGPTSAHLLDDAACDQVASVYNYRLPIDAPFLIVIP
jgi:hypothetical protein